MQMKRFIPFAAFLLVLAAASCQEERIPGMEEERYSLRFICDGLTTKSDESKGLPQERVLNSIDVYFYRDGETSSDAEFHKRLVLQDVYDLYNAHIDFLASEVSSLFYSSATCEVFAIANVDASLLPGNVTDALTGSSMPELMAKTVTSTFGSPQGADHIPSSFVMTGYNTVTLSSRAKSTVATGIIPLYRLAAKLELLIHVQDTIHLRTTYKDEFNTVYPAEEVWRPMTDRPGAAAQVEAYLENGYKDAAIGVQHAPATYTPMVSTSTPMSPALEEKFFKYSKNKMEYDDQTTVTITEARRWTYSDFEAGLCTRDQVGQDVSGETVNTVYMYSDPSYSYPITWDRGVEKEPFFKLCLPWAREGTLLVYKNGLDHAPEEISYNTAQKQYYYKIIFPMHALESNNFYRLKMNVAILGSETEDALVEMEPTYAVAGWQNKTEILEEAEVGNARFLSVPQSAYTLYNEQTLTIPYVTSDDCEIVDISWIKPYYGSSRVGQNGVSDGTAYGYPKITSGTVTLNASGASADGKWEFKLSGDKKIAFKHTLSNTQSANMDVSPYIITFTIRHKDAPSYLKTVTITQYPAIYMSQVDGGSVFVDGYFARVYRATLPGARQVTGSTTDYTSTAYAAGGTTNTFSTTATGNITVPYLNLYRSIDGFDLETITQITVTAFSSDANSFRDHSGQNVEYIIGDPRKPSGWTNSDLIPYLTSITGNRTYTNNTTNWGDNAAKIQIGETKSALIAPSLLFSSAWSIKSGNVSFETATKRCATYQEGGYPAGRWRLPTEAEVNFVHALQTYNVIPVLFASGADYWASSGYVYNGTSYTRPTGSLDSGVRCVYDVWYWGETPESVSTYHPNPE